MTKAIAYPGLPLIFAEGYGVDRVSMHGHVSLALTSINDFVNTETTVMDDSFKNSLTVDNNLVEDSRGPGMHKIIQEMIKRSGREVKLKVESRNYGILSGSSDSGAAALVTALNKHLELNLSLDELHEIARYGSETAYRSLCGGLSEYYLKEGKPHARCLLHETELKHLVVYAIPFDYSRFSADQLHQAVVKHPKYDDRIKSVSDRIHAFKSHLIERDLHSFLELMEEDAREVHRLFEEVGFTVRKPGMRELCMKIENWRKEGLECYWNVAGASVVYAFTEKKNQSRLRKKLKEFKLKELKVAGPSYVI